MFTDSILQVARTAFIVRRQSIFAKIRLQYEIYTSSAAESLLTCPLQKEPKLDRARQIPEWEVYDGEIAAFARRLQSNQTSGETDDSAEKPVKHVEL